DKTVLKLISSDTLSTEELIELYSGKPGVLFAEPNYIIKAETYAGKEDPDRETPILGKSGYAPDMTPLQYAYGSGPGGIEVPGWGSTGEKNVDEDTVIAIIDTGVDYEHEELKPVMWDKGEDYPELTALGGGKYGIFTATESNTGEKRLSNDPMDRENGHGTHCAGIAAAPWDGYGVSGTANGAKIMAVKMNFDPERGNAYNSDIVEGFNYVLTAKKAGVKVASVNCSFGSPLKSLSTAYCARELGENGVVTCFASGNDSKNNDERMWDGSITKNAPSVITVNAMDRTGEPCDFTDYGIRNTHIFAPGSEIMSTIPNTLSELLLDSRYSKPVKTVSGNELYDNYYAGAKAFDYAANPANGTKIEFKDNKLVISGTDLSIKDSITKETIAEDEPDRAAVMTIKPKGKLKELPEGSKYSLILNRHAKAIEGITWFLMVYVKTKEGKWERPKHTYAMRETPLCEYYPLDVSRDGNAFDLDDLQIRLVLNYKPDIETDTPKLEEAVIDEFWITDAQEYPYVYLNGTSMAAPAVTGEVAVLARAFPDDSAAKRAARVLAGAGKSEVLRDFCVTGGTANVRNSLDESTYTPVVNDIYADGEGLHIEGFFFGKKSDTEVSLTQGGENYSTGDGSLVLKSTGKTGKDTEELLLEVPKGLKRNEEVYVTVTDRAKSDDRKSFSRYLTPGDQEGILEQGSIYQRIDVPDGIFSSFTIFNRAASLDGSIYFTGYDSSYNHDVTEYMSKFDTYRFKDGEWDKVENAVSANGCIATFGGELVYSDYFDHKTLCFHDGKGNIRKTEFKPEKGSADIPADRPWILNAPDDKDFQIDLYYDGKDMILIRNTAIPQEDESVLFYSSVYLLDPLSGKGTYLGDLKNGYSSQVVIAHEEVSGKPNNIYVIGKGMREGTTDRYDFAAERFTVNDFSPETFNDADPEGFSDGNERWFWSGCGVKDGIYLTGPRTVKSDGNITDFTADNYYLSFKDPGKGFKACGKKICDTAIEFPVAAQGYGKVYFLGIKDTGYIMGYTDEDTLPHYGDSKEPEKAPGLSDPTSPLHRTDGKDIESVSADNAKYEFDLKKNPVVVAFTKTDISSTFETAEGYDGSAKHRYISSDKKKAKVNKKGILTPKDRGEVDINCEQKVKGGSWTKIGEPLHLYLQRPEMMKKYEVSPSEKGLSAYSFLSKTSYSPTNWISTNTKTAEVDKDGNITIHKAGRTVIIAEYGEGKNGSKKKFKTKLKVLK
ncbi:MAG: S8 family serine peptidase, partial [Lachnospiraceae bacterium]|nr:S8 family serine peptidase [Lachnospiraceae bacterium]